MFRRALSRTPIVHGSTAIKLIIIFNLRQLNFAVCERNFTVCRAVPCHAAHSFTEIQQILCFLGAPGLNNHKTKTKTKHKRCECSAEIDGGGSGSERVEILQNKCVDAYGVAGVCCWWWWWCARLGYKFQHKIIKYIIRLSSLHLEHYRNVYSLFKWETEKKKNVNEKYVLRACFACNCLTRDRSSANTNWRVTYCPLLH